MTTMSMNTLGHLSQPPPMAHGAMPGTSGIPTPVRRAVFVLTEKLTPEGTRTFWTRVGAAFDNKDGSVTVKLDALPLSGTLQIREQREDERDFRRDRAAAAPF